MEGHQSGSPITMFMLAARKQGQSHTALHTKVLENVSHIGQAHTPALHVNSNALYYLCQKVV